MTGNCAAGMQGPIHFSSFSPYFSYVLPLSSENKPKIQFSLIITPELSIARVLRAACRSLSGDRKTR